MNWNDVRYHLAVTRHGGLTGVARAVKASPSTVARRIETLEAALKTRLFERRPDGYELTEAGGAMVEKVIAIEAAMHELEDGFCGQDGRVSGMVRIVTVDTLAHHLLIPNLTLLQGAYPDLSLGVAVNATSFAEHPQREGISACGSAGPNMATSSSSGSERSVSDFMPPEAIWDATLSVRMNCRSPAIASSHGVIH